MPNIALMMRIVDNDGRRIARHQTISSIIGSTFSIVSTLVLRAQQVMNGG
jgi:hypothetical protein